MKHAMCYLSMIMSMMIGLHNRNIWNKMLDAIWKCMDIWKNFTHYMTKKANLKWNWYLPDHDSYLINWGWSLEY